MPEEKTTAAGRSRKQIGKLTRELLDLRRREEELLRRRRTTALRDSPAFAARVAADLAARRWVTVPPPLR
jgi:hypothetical protein